MERVGRLPNEIDREDFFCVEASGTSGLVVAGTEGGGVVVFDARQKNAASCFRVSSDDAVTSLALPAGSSSSVYAAAGTSVSVFDLRQLAPAPSSGQSGPGAAPAAPLRRLPEREEEVNSLALDAGEKYVATADDSGRVQVHDLAADRPMKQLSMQHTNIASCVCFRPNRTSEIVSCGQDARLVAWDFASGRCRRTWELPEVVAAAAASSSAGGDGSTLGPMVNPPLAHSVSVGPSDAAGAARVAAVAAGDGNVLLVELDSGTGRGGRGGGTGPGRAWALGRDLGGHVSGVSHACFPSFSGGRPLLLSGGNDGRVLLWDWAGVSGALAGRAEGRAPSGEAGGAAAPTARVVAEVNWLATLPSRGAEGGDAPSAADVYVADTSRFLSHYTVRDG